MNLNDALKYAAGEQEAFEKRIDQNPFDSDNHLIYADWLDDQGHAEEAAFRRAMGEWVRKGESASLRLDEKPKSFGVWARYPEGVLRPSHYINTKNLPEWAPLHRVQASAGNDFSLMEEAAHGEGYMSAPDLIWWPNYRAMEEGLRRTFRKHREQQ